MKSPSVYIASFMEAAIYGEMKLLTHRGTRHEMDERLFEIIRQRKNTKIVIFCRSEEEVLDVRRKLSEVFYYFVFLHEKRSAIYSCFFFFQDPS